MNELEAEFSPHGIALGIQMVGERDGKLYIKVPYTDHLVGDPDTGVIHGGVITAVLDNASGWSVRVSEHWTEGTSMATLDLRIDYMKPARPNEDLMVMAECYKMTKNIAFVRAIAYQEDIDDPVASSVATFMTGTPNEKRS